eukprot:scaffold845_cov364-Prasinococcus_capsulatus_cf.AAC.5
MPRSCRHIAWSSLREHLPAPSLQDNIMRITITSHNNVGRETQIFSVGARLDQHNVFVALHRMCNAEVDGWRGLAGHNCGSAAGAHIPFHIELAADLNRINAPFTRVAASGRHLSSALTLLQVLAQMSQVVQQATAMFSTTASGKITKGSASLLGAA